ncbi:hypothetical protein TSOC_004391 [Tetrabaena socialis]|uniref:Uncharacterized protein n=1 Tax=Tetrabaena socialis TaxID=47790 RepID=A0A2J8A940_9CHLO|nr:hypothetical protein TSOC_004391 [Tetrabaena socialis]|eukprot:PNH09054.1 hypothetical protein TSOC_004391 [Tetrabaena socialis]
MDRGCHILAQLQDAAPASLLRWLRRSDAGEQPTESSPSESESHQHHRSPQQQQQSTSAAPMLSDAACRQQSASNAHVDSVASKLFDEQAGVPQLSHLPDGAAAEEAEKVDASRAERELGLQYTPLQQTLTDMAASLIKLGLAVPASTA